MKKQLRIKKSEEIEKLIKIKNTVGDKFFVVYSSDNNLKHFRCALSVSKKYGDAHERNQIKRQIRSIINENSYTLSDFFIVIKPSAKSLSYRELKKIINKLLERANLIKENNK